MENFISTVFATVLASIAFALGLVYVPLVSFALGYVGGVLLNWIVGAQLSSGMNLIFNTTRFTRESLPIVLATASVIGSYFTQTQSGSKEGK